MKTKYFLIGLFGLLIYSCSPKIVPPPPPPVAVKSDKIFGSLAEEGKYLYENNCAKCHKLYDPKSFSSEDWKPILVRMQKKAKISDDQREKIYNYIITMN